MCEILDGSNPVALGNSGDNPITSQAVIDIGVDQTTSVAVQLEGFSLVVVAYTNTNGNFIAIVSHCILSCFAAFSLFFSISTVSSY